MNIPQELFRDVLLNVTDEDQFKNLCKASPFIMDTCRKEYFLKELYDKLSEYNTCTSYKVYPSDLDIKILFKNKDLQQIIKDTEDYIKKDLEISNIRPHHRRGDIIYHGDDDNNFYIIKNLNKHIHFMRFIGELWDAVKNGEDVTNDLSDEPSDDEFSELTI